MTPLITCEHVDFGYDNQDAVVDVNMEVDAGDYLCIVGENGSGKSTLMKGLLGLLKPTAGRLTVAEELKRTGIGYLPQQTAAQKDFPATVWEVVLSGALSRAGRLPFYSKEEKALAEKNMEKLGITPLKKHCYRELSGGQQQRVLIARALCATSRLLILDEPITGLDPAAIQDLSLIHISGCDTNKTGWLAVKLGLAGFLLPVMFVLNPSCLLYTSRCV